MDYGAFVQLEPGIEGLLHISQLSPLDSESSVKEIDSHIMKPICYV